MLTFEEFQATRRDVDDLEKVLGVEINAEGTPVAGLVYAGDLFIEKSGDGTYHLVISNHEWVDADLAVLERELYAFYLDERCDSTPTKGDPSPSP